ncbi:MAG: transporter [Prevotella sp.]|jgi:BASS family bile acid:Na+ symporter|nr:transporter [Prevotella sp.]
MNKLVRFVKDWTLPVAMGLGAMLYLVFAFVPSLDGAATFFAPLMDDLLPVFMFMVLFVTFCKVDFRRMRPVWWHFWVLFFNLLFVGVVMAIALYLTSPSLTSSASTIILLESLLMCIIAPCATAAAVVTQKLGGSLEQMTTYTFLSNFLTVLLVPVCFPLLEKGSDVSFMAAFWRIMSQVAMLLVLPMLLAYIVKHYMHRLHRQIISVRDLSFYLWACSLMIVTGTTVKNIVHAEASLWLLTSIAFLGLAACIVQFAVGRFIGHFFGHTQEAGQGLGQKNTAFAIWLSYTYLHPLSSVGPGCYILWQNIINSVEIWLQRKTDSNYSLKSSSRNS